MNTFLMFRLYGPIASWGDIAVGDDRPSAHYPSKSAILGLIAAALGIDRNKDNEHTALSQDYQIGIRVDAQGKLLRDYHTAQVPPQQKKTIYRSRRDELQSEKLETTVSRRDYRVDSSYTIAIWTKNPEAQYSPTSIETALRKPIYVLYLGRKSCPPSLPLAPKLIKAPTLKVAFDKYSKLDSWELKLQANHCSYYWEKLSSREAGMEAIMSSSRRDTPLSRVRWQFTERNEFFYSDI